MAGTSLFALIDDIATLLDDVALMTKVAAKKTAGVLGDDLAVNAQQVAGVNPDRELPVVWAVFVGSMRNKAILVPAALLISVFIPAAITPLLILGGIYLCYEGVEKIVHHFAHDREAEHQRLLEAVVDPQVDLVAFEQDKIRGAVRTDFILSAEIIAISLGTVAEASMTQQISVLVVVALLMTVGVYGFVAAIVKLDDAGLYLSQKTTPWKQLGYGLVNTAPYLMKFLSIAGTIAMFLVGGGIILHGIHALADMQTHISEMGQLGAVLAHGIPALIGLCAGAIALLGVTLVKRLRSRR
jgi:uncharacterized protein